MAFMIPMNITASAFTKFHRFERDTNISSNTFAIAFVARVLFFIFIVCRFGCTRARAASDIPYYCSGPLNLYVICAAFRICSDGS